MLVKIFKLVCVFLVGGQLNHAVASEARLKQFFAEVNSLTANFEQTVVDQTGSALERSNGVFYLSRPGQFRWDYKSADPAIELSQQIIADGKFIYLYDPDLEQVVKRSMSDALAQVPSLVLVHTGGQLAEHFMITDFGMTDGLSWVALKPKSEDASYQQLMIAFSGSELRNIVLLDGLGNETRLVLSQVKNNQTLAPDTFNFTLPDGVDLLEE